MVSVSLGTWAKTDKELTNFLCPKDPKLLFGRALTVRYPKLVNLRYKAFTVSALN